GTAGGAATYTLSPWAGSGASRAVKFTDPSTGEIYYLQLKAPVGYDAPTAVNGNLGVQIIKSDINVSESLLIPPSTQPYSGYYSSNLSWQAGQTFTTDGGTQVKINSVSSSSASVTVTAMAALIGSQMDAKAQQWSLGAATSAITAIRNGGYYRNYQGGAVIWTPANGAMVSHGVIRSLWATLGFENGVLGYPTTDEVGGLRNGGIYQNYEGGAIIWSQATGAHSSMGAIRQRWQQMGFENGILGYPTSETIGGLRNGGSFQNYEGGAIMWSPTTGAHESVGPIRDRWGQLGFEGGSLGYPVSNVIGGLRNGGSFQNYEGGAIMWSPTTGAQESVGPIRVRWGQLGFEGGSLGYPVSNVIGGLRNGGTFQNYEGGAIIWSSATGAHESVGPIRDRWAQLGFEGGIMGYPVSNVIGGLRNGGTFQNYEGGSILWSQASGAHSVSGKIRDAWASTGFESGKLGYPTSEVYTVPNGTAQDFQGGKIVYSNGTATITYTS
ncbi:LGFP repeat-containing protein, partial [Sinomonas sp.]|uniref:LGFP repeat-containing protein n=1 Tax=Sinomonas sp. TaxID=1914986 RepID=UPI003F7D2444